ncbi:MAG TPA: hypothetical protein VHC49_11500, partial [Mycobacteriales bacterium]|nr:hypothetical protein [Mycobacteriales bacterium]
AAVVSDDLADAFGLGGDYLEESVRWALGLRSERPDGIPAMAASLRLEDALRGFLAEQGTKYVPKEQLWRLVGGALRLRLTAYSLAGLPHPSVDPDPARGRLGEHSQRIARWYGDLAAELRRPTADRPIVTPEPHGPYPSDDVPAEHLSCTLWVGEHLRHLSEHLEDLTGPAAAVADRRATPWWR